MKKRSPKLSEKRRKLVRKKHNRSVGVAEKPPQAQLDALLHFYSKGKLGDAESLAITITDTYPRYPLAWKVLASIYLQTGQLVESVRAGRTIVELSPTDPQAHNNLGSALEQQGDLEGAFQNFTEAIALSPDFFLAHFNMGVLQRHRGELEEARQSFHRAIALDDKHAGAYNSLGVTLGELGQWSAAESSYRQAIECNSQHAGAHRNLGGVLQHTGRYREAEASYRTAIQINQKFDDALNDLCSLLLEVDRFADAEVSGLAAIKANPLNFRAFNNLAGVYQSQGRLAEAAELYRSASELQPSSTLPRAQWLHQQQHMCDFTEFGCLVGASRQLGIVGDAIPPFIVLTWSDNPEHHLSRARTYCKETFKEAPQALPAKPIERPARLKIGYFSADFHDFPGMYLMAGLLESHDRERFEVYAFSYGPDKDDAMRRRIVAAVDHFIDIREMPTQEVVDLSREHGIDIALHRNGHTKGTRTELFQHRLAPVQISYLGYPGTLGADFIDYLVADPVVIPEEERQYYSEKIIYLPDTYQPNDNTRQIAETNTTRADFGLPEEGFVLCCFNQNYKISPREFDIWMRVLGQVEGSVLWLLKSNRWAEENLKKEAEHRGIDPSRVIFAEKIPHAEHLARHKHADLFVDTFNYNAHTTASDALWSGLPVVTKQGRQFAARVAASLLTAVGLPELITESEEDYERLILELAANPEKLIAIKETLKANLQTEPLFDTHRYARQFETGLIEAYEIYFGGSMPKDLRINV
jgi:protein O-GlcNAc transferase